MMKDEFEKLTGFYPSSEMYAAIEDAYMRMDEFSNKQDFCAAYCENRNGLAEQIQLEADRARQETERKAAALEKTAQELREQLDKELDWKPYFMHGNCLQNTYERIASDPHVSKMTADEAKQYLYDRFGFAKEKTVILSTVPKFEINRHGVIRKNGWHERDPLFFASDMNYIRFDCGERCYELVNGDMRTFNEQ